MTSSTSGCSPASAASSTSSGRNRLPPASIRWLAASVTNGNRLWTCPESAFSTSASRSCEPRGERVVEDREAPDRRRCQARIACGSPDECPACAGQVENRAGHDAEDQGGRDADRDGRSRSAATGSHDRTPPASPARARRRTSAGSPGRRRTPRRCRQHRRRRPPARRRPTARPRRPPTCRRSPPVSGMPAMESRKNAKTPGHQRATACRARPTARTRVASPPASRTSVTMAKVPTVARP